MRIRFDPLAFCRAHSRGLARAMLPVLVVGWLGAVGPCVGMAAAPSPADGAAPAAQPGHADAEHASPEAAEGRHGHGACSHCPDTEGGAPSDAHVLCAAVEDVADLKTAAKSSPPDLKTALPPEAHVASAPARWDESCGPALYEHVFPPVVPLRLRHCVLRL